MNWKILQVRASFWRIVLPAIVTVIIFVSTIFLLILPFIEESNIDRKREMIHELVSLSWTDLAFYEELERSGKMTRLEAQNEAKEHLRTLRFGSENSDYFWIHDNNTVMIMHPYRPDLEGQDLSTYRDPNGKFLFSEMVTVVAEHGEGYIDYMWQWKDDPSRIVPKISYVKEFEPWGWILGSGIYIEDVKAEVVSFTRGLVWVCVGIVLLVTVLAIVVILQGVASRSRWRKAEEEARQHLVRLSHLSRLHSMKTMATEIAHQIDQPLGSILLRSSFCSDTYFLGDPVTPELLENLDAISTEVERTAQIVKRIRNFSNSGDMEKKRVELNSLIGGVIGFLAGEIKNRQVGVGVGPENTALETTEPVWVVVDQTLIEQVVMNIVRNAIEAMADSPAGQRRLSVWAEVEGDRALVVCQDTGPGIDEDQLESVFESFTSSKNDGLGMGLAICRSIVEEHGGRLWAENSPGSGSVFKFTLPTYC